MGNLSRIGLALGFVFACLSSCKTLPDTGTCGNGIVEVDRGEECDGTTTLANSTCNSQCHFMCKAFGETAGPNCPGGYFCGADGTCRAPSGEFEPMRDTIPSDAFRVDVADIDGDSLKDLVASSPRTTQVWFSNGQSFERAFEIPNTASKPPLIASIARDPSLPPRTDEPMDLLFGTGLVSVWQGQSSKQLTPIQYPTLVFGDAPQGVRVVAANTHSVLRAKGAPRSSPGDESYLFIPGPGGASFIAILHEAARLPTPVQTLRASAERIAGEVRVAKLAPGECPSLVYAFVGEPGVDVFSPCKAIPNGTIPDAPLPAAASVLTFPPSTTAPLVVAEQGVLLTDIDRDGKLDILIHAVAGESKEPQVLVAYGVGDGSFRDAAGNAGRASAARDDEVHFNKVFTNQEVFPLAAGQLTPGDNDCDFVFPDRILLRSSQVPDGGATAFEQTIPAPENLPWNEAAVDDYNNDGLPDVIAGSNETFDFYAGTSRPGVMNPFGYVAGNGASHFAKGDFDGDQVDDIAFAGRHELFVAFGIRNGGPHAPVSVGRFPAPVQHVSSGLGPDSRGVTDGISDITVVGRESDTSPAQVVSVLAGSVDRKPFSPYPLRAAPAFDVTEAFTAAVGKFEPGDQHLDIVALGAPRGIAPNPNRAFSLWTIPLTGEARIKESSVVVSDFDEDDASSPFLWKKAVMVSVPLGGGVDSLAVAVPRKEKSAGDTDVTGPGKLMILRPEAGAWTLQSSVDLGGGPGTGSEAADLAFDWRIRTTDIDSDEARDLVVLYDESDPLNRQKPITKISVFFNRKDGTFTNPMVIDPIANEALVDCAWLHADAHSTDKDKKDLVVLTRAREKDGEREKDSLAVYLIHFDVASHRFLQPVLIGPTRNLPLVQAAAVGFRGSIGTGDVDADGIEDILVATGNRLVGYRGKPLVGFKGKRQ